MSATHARPTRLAALFRSIPRAASAALNRDWNGAQAILLAGVFAALGVPGTLVHECPDAASIMPCCGASEWEVPQSDRVTAVPGLVTCNARRSA